MSTATISPDRPRFRQDLVAEAIEDNGARYIDVIDPDTGGEFRFFEAEYAVACAMDGERDIPGLVRWAQEELGITPSPAELKNVIATLGDLGYLDAMVADTSPRVDVAAPAPAPAVAVAAAAPVVAAPATPAVVAVPVVAAKAPIVEDDELAPGIVVAKPAAAAASVADFELGQSGPVANTGPEPKIDAGNFELGASGASAKRTPPLPKTQNVDLGPAGASDEPSTDLSEHLAIKPGDVKEAVRASQIMQAVLPPPDVEIPVAAPVVVAPVVEAKPEPKVEAKPEPKVEAKPEPKVEAKPEPKAEPKTEAKGKTAPSRAGRSTKSDKPSVAATKAAVVERVKAPVPEAKKEAKGPNKGLLAVLVLALLGGGGYLVWKYVINKDKTADVESSKPATPPPVKPVAPPPPPPAPTAKLALEPMPAVGVKPIIAGVVEITTAEGSDVKAGEAVVRLNGFQALAPQVATLEKEVKETVPAEIAKLEADRDAATTANNKALADQKEAQAVTRRTRLTQKEAQLKAKQDELAKFVIIAPVAGKVTKAAAKGTKVTATDDVATIEPMGLTATFDVPKGASFEAGAKASFNVKDAEKGAPKLECDVVNFDGATNKLKVACPASDKIAAGTELSM